MVVGKSFDFHHARLIALDIDAKQVPVGIFRTKIKTSHMAGTNHTVLQKMISTDRSRAL